MRFRDLIFLVGANLRRMKMRLALTSLGVVIGTSAIVLMISLGIGLQNNVMEELGSIGSANQITVMGGGMGPEGGESQPLDDRAVKSFEAIENVESVVPGVMVQTAQGVEYKKYVGYLNLTGVPMDSFEDLGYKLEAGRLPRNEKEILLGASAAQGFSTDGPPRAGEAALKSADLLGKRLTITFMEQPDMDPGADPGTDMPPVEPAQFTRKLAVVGVLAAADMQTDQFAYVTLDAALDLNGVKSRRPTYEQVTIRVTSPAQVPDVEKVITDQGFVAMSARSMQEGLKSTFLIIQGVLGALGAIAMLVASLGIANTMTMSIFERTREIGIMKAVGASNRQIKRVFLGEAAVIGVLGGIGGLAISASGAALANLFASGFIASQTAAQGGATPELRTFFDIPVGLGLFAVVFAAGVGLLAGVLPAVRASNLDPLTALRHE